MIDAPAPLVSIGVPLYRSRRFLPIIVNNLEAIDYPNVEILISDRHGLDDTLDVLRRRYGSDRRFRFIEATDGLNWVEHTNRLLEEAAGTYFVCMAHDDSFPAGYLGSLAAALEQQVDAVLAFGRVEQLSMDGFLPAFPFVPPPVSTTRNWTLGCSLRLLTAWHLWFAFRGMVRREVVSRNDLYLRQTYRNIRADVCWLFGLSLKGRFVHVPSCSYVKRFYRSSTGADWKFGIHQSLDAARVLRGYLRDYASPGPARLLAETVVLLWSVSQGVLPAAVARRVGIFARRVLAPR